MLVVVLLVHASTLYAHSRVYRQPLYCSALVVLSMSVAVLIYFLSAGVCVCASFCVCVCPVERMLDYDPATRIKPMQALNHPFLREEEVPTSPVASSAMSSTLPVAGT